MFSKKVLSILLGIFLVLPINSYAEGNASISDEWLSKALKNIEDSEYRPRLQASRCHFTNRANNLRAYFDENGVELVPMAGNNKWDIKYSVNSPEAFKPEIIDNEIVYRGKGIDVEYSNSKEGIKQFITINKGDSRKYLIKADLSVEGLELLERGEKRLNFSGSGEKVRYEIIGIKDAEGKALEGFIKYSSSEGLLTIGVKEDEIKYPVEIGVLITGESDNVSEGLFRSEIIKRGLSDTPDWMSESNQVDACFGYSVSTAGDVNGDGYSDVIVGAYHYDNGESNEGRAFVYYGSSSGLSTSPDWMGESNQAGAYFGGSVSAAGDVNGDGYSDVIVGAYRYNNGETGEGAAFVYHGSSSGLSTSPNWMGESNQASAYFGISVSTAGDVNGDGYSDVIVGAYFYDNGESSEGAAFVYHGSSSGLSTSPDWTGESNQAGAHFGYSVSTAGDVNGDGYSDVIVGAYLYDNGETDEGRAFVYHGSSSGLSSVPDWTAESDQANACFGGSVSTAGDVNGDGYSDVIVGAYQYDIVGGDEGAAFVYYGGSTGLSFTYDWMGKLYQTDARFGISVSTAGDVNGDGYSDVIVGAPCYDNGETDEGRAFVFYGSSTGLSTSPDWMSESNQAGAHFGYSVSTAGDVNGGGYSDVIVGAYGYDNGESNEGRAFVYHGSGSGLSSTPDWTGESNQISAGFGISVSTAGDVNGDGYSDVIVGAPYYNNGESNEGAAFVYYGSSTGLSFSYDWMGESDQAYAEFGYSVSTAGDVNGDGYSDVIVGAYLYDNGQTDEGAAFVYYGSGTGLSITPDWTAESNQANACFGYSVSTAGDVNGDGYSDVIVGAYGYDNGESNEGAAFVYHGSLSGLSISPDWTEESNQASAYFGISVSTAGDVNGDGYSDVIVGAHGYDNGESLEGAAFVYYGSSTGLSSTYDWMDESNQAYAYFGRSVSTAGDVNGDGYSDVIVGAYSYDNEGAAFVYYGSSTGLSSTYDWMDEPNQGSAFFGYSVSTAGDVNWDGYSDVIVGAYGYDNGESNEGRAFVYHGSSTGLSTTLDWTGESNQANACFGISVSTAGDVNGDGYSDVIVGANGYDNGETNEGCAFVYYGIASGIEEVTDIRKDFSLMVSSAISFREFKIGYNIPEIGARDRDILVRISIYDMSGRLVKKVFKGERSSGYYEVRWDGRGEGSMRVPSGVYFINLQCGDFRDVKKAILLK